jgi:hypothetical protein
MKTGFKEPNAIKNQKPKDVTKSPWDFRCPQYDNRSSCFVNAGTDYGVCINQPIGHSNNPKQRAETMPMGVKTMDLKDNY